MVKRPLQKVRAGVVLAALGTTLAMAQTPAGALQEGDKVEAQDCAHGCVWRAGVVGKQYGLLVVIFDSSQLPDGTRLDAIWGSQRITDPTRVRKIGAAGLAQFKVGDRVDDQGARPSHGRGVVIEAKAPTYRVKYDGCGDTFNAWRDASELSAAASISPESPEVRGLIGRWDMFVAGAPTTVRKGNDLYREYSTGAKAPPLEIRSDGSYTWMENFHQPPVTGRWQASARIGDAQIGAERFDGLVILDRSGSPWKVYRRNADQMEMRLICSGQSQMGTRIR